ncbi:MAG: extracellular solute-binding protein [Deinococcota bacterium]
MTVTLAQADTVLNFWTISLSPTFNDYIETTLDRYEAAHPGHEVIWRDFSGDALYFELINALDSGNVPDVVNLNVPLLLEFAERGSLQALPEESLTAYFPRMVDALRASGTAYGVPWYITPPLVIYNSQMFEAAGLDPDTPPETVRQLIQIAKHIKDETGLYGFMPNVGAQRMLYRFAEAGLPLLSEDGFDALFDSPEHVALLASYAAMFQDDYFPEDVLLRGYVGALERYNAGQLAMLITGPQFLTRIASTSPDIYAVTRVTAYPLAEDGILHAPLMTLAVPTGAALDPALSLTQFLTNPDSQVAFAEVATIYPTTAAAREADFFQQDDGSLEARARRVQAGQLDQASDLTLDVPNSKDLHETFMKAMEAAFYGHKTPQEALKEVVIFWNSRL